MNTPAPESLKGKYSAVLDGGSLEHIFDFPTSIKSCMEMVQLGGHYLSISPANNFFGHGFYQFSPELYFSVLSRENGFEIERMYAFEDRPRATWYRVSSPQSVQGRVTLMNSRGVYLLVIARRLINKPIFERTPQQSDYVSRWDGVDATAPSVPTLASALRRPLPIRVAKAIIPARLRRAMRGVMAARRRPYVGFDPRFFQPFDPAAPDPLGSSNP